MTDIIASVLILMGSIMTFAAGVGILRLPDLFTRMHAATKVGTLGSGLTMAGAAVYFGDPGIVLRCILIIGFLLLTAPIGAHMIGRAALSLKIPVWKPKDDPE